MGTGITLLMGTTIGFLFGLTTGVVLMALCKVQKSKTESVCDPDDLEDSSIEDAVFQRTECQ